MDTVLKFSVNDIEFIDEVNNMLFRKAKIRAFASGENTNTLPIDEKVLRRGATTIYNKPILWKYNKFLDDAEGHEIDEVPCGFIPEVFNNKENPVEFERDNDGRVFIVITAYIWTKYSGKLIEIFKRDDSKKNVSIEIVVVNSNDKGIKPEILEFVISGITILGEWVNPACKGCRAELMEFSEDKKKYEKLYFSENIEIDNSKDSAISGSWSNPRNKLFTPIINATNTESLLKEAYLINNNMSDDSSMADHKYPHHIIKDKKLVIHKNGLKAAFQRASQQGIVKGDVRSHLLRHYRELGLSIENYSEFNITKVEFEEYFAEYFKDTESVGDKKLNIDERKELLNSYFSKFTFTNNEETFIKYAIDEVGENTVKCTDNESGCKYEIKYSISDDNEVSVDMSNITKMDDEHHKDTNIKDSSEETSTFEDEDSHNKDTMFDDEDKNDDRDDEIEELKNKYSELESRCAELEKANKVYMEEIEKMSDYKDLKKFKEDKEAEEKKNAELAEMNKVMSDIEEKGIEMSDDEKKELMDKVSEFSSINAWSNSVKAQIFDKVENIDGILKIGSPFSNTDNNNQFSSIWDRI